MTIVKNLKEIELIRESSLIVSKTLGMLALFVRPGITGIELDKMAEDFIRSHDAEPGFLGLYNFPNTLCISPNSKVVHGIPNSIPFEEGDIVSIDCGVLKNGFYGDHAYTFEVGEVDPEVKKMVEITKQSLYLGIDQFRIENRVGDIGYVIQNFIESHGYSVVRELVGHGLGRKMHEDPKIPNYGSRGRGKKLIEGMVIAIEPMVNMGSKFINQSKDGWTISTRDKKPSAHFEHDIAIVNGKPELLSTFKYINDALGIVTESEDRFRDAVYET